MTAEFVGYTGDADDNADADDDGKEEQPPHQVPCINLTDVETELNIADEMVRRGYAIFVTDTAAAAAGSEGGGHDD